MSEPKADAVSEVVEAEWEMAGRWEIHFAAGGGSLPVEIKRKRMPSGADQFDPRLDDSGGALRFYYLDGRRRIFSYTTVRMCVYTPIELVPL